MLFSTSLRAISGNSLWLGCLMQMLFNYHTLDYGSGGTINAVRRDVLLYIMELNMGFTLLCECTIISS